MTTPQAEALLLSDQFEKIDCLKVIYKMALSVKYLNEHDSEIIEQAKEILDEMSADYNVRSKAFRIKYPNY